MNKIILTGNLTKEPELRRTQSGKAVVKAGIAVNQGYGDKQTTDFFNLIAWEKTAELIGKYLNKGSKILVEGRLKNNNYEDNKGVKHYGVDVIVESIEFMDSKSSAKKKAANDYNDGAIDDDDMPF